MRQVIAGAIGGFVTALLVDINAWEKSPGAFDWSLAVRRWILGAITGAAAVFAGSGGE